MRRITPKTRLAIYKLELEDYERQLADIKEKRLEYTVAEYRKETGIFFNLIAHVKKQITKLEELR